MEETRSEDYATAYRNNRRAFSRNKPYLENMLEDEWASIGLLLKKCPGALYFLNDQKENAYSKRIIQFLKKSELNPDKINPESYWNFGLAVLGSILPDTEKQYMTKGSIIELARETCIVTTGVDDLRKKEALNLIKKRNPTGFCLSPDGSPIFLPSDDHGQQSQTFLPIEINGKDVEFLEYYKTKVKAIWYKNAGLAHYVYDPIELNISERIESLPSKHFYEQISDSILSLYKYISIAGQKARYHTKRWVN
jgi:hypothetical protein